jgi:hypothetical protein
MTNKIAINLQISPPEGVLFKMVSISLGNRFRQKFSRIQVDNVNLSGKIAYLREQVSKIIDAPLEEIGIIAYFMFPCRQIDACMLHPCSF